MYCTALNTTVPPRPPLGAALSPRHFVTMTVQQPREPDGEGVPVNVAIKTHREGAKVHIVSVDLITVTAMLMRQGGWGGAH
jgi:hypothetical protein